MRVRHLTDDEVISLLLNPTPDRVTRERARWLKHFTDCGTCHERFNDFARLVSLVGEGEVWEEHRAMSDQQREWLRRVKAALHQISEERAGLDEVVEATITDSPARWKASLALHERFHTYGMVEALLERGIRLSRSKPSTAADLSAMAVSITDQLPLDAYPFDLVISLRARAYREHAVSLSYIGRVVEALPFLDRAQQLTAQTPSPTFELARIAVARALIYRDMDRLDEAVQLTRDAAATFLSFDDRTRYANTKMTEGALLFRQRRYDEARSIWLALEDEPSLQDQPAYGMLLQQLGSAHRQLNQFERAREYYTRAAAVHRKHNATTDELRVHWSLALTLLAEGNQREALPILRQTWHRFTDLKMLDDAALVALKVAEVLLMLDQPNEVPSICRTLLDHFARNVALNRTPAAAVVALSYLREALAAGKAKPTLVSDIHDFIRDLPTNPMRTYTPPEL